jgi:hypothetical protein
MSCEKLFDRRMHPMPPQASRVASTSDLQTRAAAGGVRYPEVGDRVLVLLRHSRRFMHGTVSAVDSLGFTVRESWNHSWSYGDFGRTWLWDDGSGRIVEVSGLGVVVVAPLKPWRPFGSKAPQ